MARKNADISTKDCYENTFFCFTESHSMNSMHPPIHISSTNFPTSHPHPNHISATIPSTSHPTFLLTSYTPFLTTSFPPFRSPLLRTFIHHSSNPHPKFRSPFVHHHLKFRLPFTRPTPFYHFVNHSFSFSFTILSTSIITQTTTF